MTPEYGPLNLLPTELSIITAHASGRALEFGTGLCLGTHALMASRCDTVISIDENQDYTFMANARFSDPRVEFKRFALSPSTGWYNINPSVMFDPFDTVVLDGPEQKSSQIAALPWLKENELLLPGYKLLVMHAGDASIVAAIAEWHKTFRIKRTTLATDRGVVLIEDA